jgi:hypothetical protein
MIIYYLLLFIKIRRIRIPCFNIDGCAILWTVALKRPIFKQKKGFANISLGLNYCSMGSSWQRSRDTVPLTRYIFGISIYMQLKGQSQTSGFFHQSIPLGSLN